MYIYRCICSSHGRLGFYAEIQIIFVTVCSCLPNLIIFSPIMVYSWLLYFYLCIFWLFVKLAVNKPEILFKQKTVYMYFRVEAYLVHIHSNFYWSSLLGFHTVLFAVWELDREIHLLRQSRTIFLDDFHIFYWNKCGNGNNQVTKNMTTNIAGCSKCFYRIHKICETKKKFLDNMSQFNNWFMDPKLLYSKLIFYFLTNLVHHYHNFSSH